ncbi:MAG: hypothetical protein LIR46_01725, partial [Bacteroidota bacterium]|nr:hypothetical protein [Bacteroidota bacterium]
MEIPFDFDDLILYETDHIKLGRIKEIHVRATASIYPDIILYIKELPYKGLTKNGVYWEGVHLEDVLLNAEQAGLAALRESLDNIISFSRMQYAKELDLKKAKKLLDRTVECALL